MAEAKVRRLPVVSADGKLQGLLSMDDVVGRTHTKATPKGTELTSEDVVSTLKRLYAPRLSAELNKAAGA
jgi:CBS domain-containing protein